MKKMPAIFAGLALVCGFSLFAAGCTEHREMNTMDAGMETMHKEPMGSMDKGIPMEEKKEM